MRVRDLFGRLVGDAGKARREDASDHRSERLPHLPRVIRWAWASAVTTGIVMALTSGQGVSRSEVLELLKAVTALVDVESPAPAKDQQTPAEQQGPPVFVPDPKWDR